jgi:predicted DNA-binding protein YlxM (UPF0122 family)
MKTTYIYGISHRGLIRYIGKSNNPRRRLYQHINEKSNKHKYNWLNNIIKNNDRPTIEIIDEVPEEEWEFWEQYWISQFKTWGFKLINATNGGDGSNGYKHSEKSKRKMRRSKLGTKLPQEQRDKISKSVKQKFIENPGYNRSGNNLKTIIDKDLIYNLYIVENLSLNKIANRFGYGKKKIFDTLKEYNISKSKEVWKDQLSTHPKKIILQYDLNGNLIKEWSGLEKIQKETGINMSNIANCCRGIGVTAGNYIWRYRDEFIEVDLNRLNYKKRSVKRYDMIGNFIKEYESIKDTILDGFNDGNVQLCCSGKQKSHKGCMWIYSEDTPPIEYKNKTIKSVLQYDKDMNFIREWDSISMVTKKLGIGGNSITSCCKGKYKSAGGYIWKYKEE